MFANVDQDKCGDEWATNYKHYGHYARQMKRWYSRYGKFLALIRRKYKPCTAKNKSCRMRTDLTKKIATNRDRQQTFQTTLDARLAKWGKECAGKGKVGEKIKKSEERAKKIQEQQERYVRYRKQYKESKKLVRGTPEYKASIEKVEKRFQTMLDFYRAGKDKWIKKAEAAKPCEKDYHHAFRYVKYYARREMRLLRRYGTLLEPSTGCCVLQWVKV